MTQLSPAYDHHIARRYSIGSLDQKIQNKTALQEELGWPKEPKRPILCLPAGMTETLGGELLRETLPGILSLEVEILILGKGSAAYGSLFTKLAQEQKHRMHIVSSEESAVRRMVAAADMALFLSEHASKELAFCLPYGVVPIAPRLPGLEDYNPVQETGNAFLFEAKTEWHCFAALVRACETYRFPFDWRTIQRHCMESVERA
ncbi:hypothetical protein HY285_01635 [Candidatus Peregrinibacteria bacterium]|nr:hypothetical protein [Candidatus Peregrinibacteria bacterium]